MEGWEQYIGTIYHGDCMELMRGMPDDAVDLLLTDPPYGMANAEARTRFGSKDSRFEKYRQMAGGGHWKYGDEMTTWDIAPDAAVFTEMFRVSKNQIIWGGNYFELPPTRCFNVWRKLTISERFTMAMCEYAWTSFATNAKWWEFAPQDKDRFHPTQKPLKLICRQLEEYTRPGDLVLDCFSGSGTVAVACALMGRRCIAAEVHDVYHARSMERLRAATAQQMLPMDAPCPVQASLPLPPPIG